MSFSLPTIDISPYLTTDRNHSFESNKAIVTQIRQTCRTTGFFQIINHGINPALQSGILVAAKHFFALPLDLKRQYIDTTAKKGYEEIGAQALEPGSRPDIKECYFVGSEPTVCHEPPYKPFEYPNIWPEPSILPEAVFKEPILKYHEAMCRLAQVIMEILVKGLEDDFPRLKSGEILEEFCREPCASLRLLRYPGPSSNRAATSVGEVGDTDESAEMCHGDVVAGAHTDFRGITLLLQDGNRGLQVLHRGQGLGQNGEKQELQGVGEQQMWIDVPSTPHAFVVNIGDMFERWTGGWYRSTVHRVVSRCGGERYSVPFFYDGNLEFVVRSLTQNGSLGGGRSGEYGQETEEMTVREYLLKKFDEIYL
ncbi:isopenicillin N synthase family dioxygenase [Aspergillus homomorphus CBS 101889]|uniref:Clavaminate synthase-like protein n=1 Tax=Aspergillus homomorphus (strain CBS 101889) TaxID=1450537 RepID=A0A395HQV3_ASPHC|nr:Clavaminate synthase-like protein [Aspergillus homomorphus CBS 101889]RAL10197.1 Clavaminate synthase-like protein [Aspergillus homomorphus CBS 101889]